MCVQMEECRAAAAFFVDYHPYPTIDDNKNALRMFLKVRNDTKAKEMVGHGKHQKMIDTVRPSAMPALLHFVTQSAYAPNQAACSSSLLHCFWA